MTTQYINDSKLVEASRGGDCSAFRVLVERYHSLVCGVAYSVVGDRAAVDDVAQEVFITAWHTLKRLRDPGRFRPWLCGITRNVARGWRRHRRRHNPESLALPLDELHEPATCAPEERLAARRALSLVWSALARAPRRYREPFVLVAALGKSNAEAAEILGLREDAVRQRVCRARMHIRSELGDLLGDVLGDSRGKVAAAVALAIMSSEAVATTASGAFIGGALLSKLSLGVCSVAAVGILLTAVVGDGVEPEVAIAPVVASSISVPIAEPVTQSLALVEASDAPPEPAAIRTRFSVRRLRAKHMTSMEQPAPPLLMPTYKRPIAVLGGRLHRYELVDPRFVPTLLGE